MRLPPPLVTLIFAAIMFGLDNVYRAEIPSQISLAVAILFAVLAVVFLSPALVQFYKHKTTVNPYTPYKTSTLVTTGVYRFSRNPMYVGMAMALASWAFYLANSLCFILVGLFTVYITHFQIRFEEMALIEQFQEEFEQYAKRVRRWL